jgi:hypothetical protein
LTLLLGLPLLLLPFTPDFSGSIPCCCLTTGAGTAVAAGAELTPDKLLMVSLPEGLLLVSAGCCLAGTACSSTLPLLLEPLSLFATLLLLLLLLTATSATSLLPSSLVRWRLPLIGHQQDSSCSSQTASPCEALAGGALGVRQIGAPGNTCGVARRLGALCFLCCCCWLPGCGLLKLGKGCAA